MSETSMLNCSMFTPFPNLLELAKDSANTAAHLTHVAVQADEHNMRNLRNSLSTLAQSFAAHSQTLLDLCTAEGKKRQESSH